VGGEEEAGVRVVCVGVWIYMCTACSSLHPSHPKGTPLECHVLRVQEGRKCGVGGRAAV